MTFEEHVALYPPLLQFWILWLMLILMVTPVLLLLSKDTRRDGLVVAGVAVLSAIAMQWLFSQVGFVRLLGAVHAVLWTPMLVYLVARFRKGAFVGFRRTAMLVFLATVVVSLVFDYADVARYLMGDRAPVTGPANG